MKPAKLACPHASYGAQMRIYCAKSKEECTYQHFCSLCGWYKLDEAHTRCAYLKEADKNEQRETKAAKKRRNKV